MESTERVSEAATHAPCMRAHDLAATAGGSDRLTSGSLLGVGLGTTFLHLAHPLLQLRLHLRDSRRIALVSVGALAALVDRTSVLHLLLERGARFEGRHGGASEDHKRVELGGLVAHLDLTTATLVGLLLRMHKGTSR